MNKKTILLFLVFKIVIIGIASSVFGESDHNYNAVPFSRPEYPVKNIIAEAYPEGQITVSGVVKNAYLNPVEGTAVIYFLDSSYNVIYITETEVNNNRIISPGGSGSFEVTAMIDNVLNVKKVYIEFVKH